MLDFVFKREVKLFKQMVYEGRAEDWLNSEYYKDLRARKGYRYLYEITKQAEKEARQAEEQFRKEHEKKSRDALIEKIKSLKEKNRELREENRELREIIEEGTHPHG